MIFLPLERLMAVQPRKLFCKSFASDIGFYFISGLIPGLLLAPPMALAAIAGYAIVPHSLHTTVAAVPIWARALAALVVGEIGFYWGHRWAHEIPLLWRFHSVHHNPAQVYFLISARAHPIDNVFIRLCGLLPIAVLGIASPLTPSGGTVSALLVLVLTIWGFLDPREPALAAGPAGMGDFDPGLSSLAPHLGGAAGSELRVDATDHGLDLRHPLPAAGPMADGLRHQDEVAEFAGRTAGVSATPGVTASQLAGGRYRGPVSGAN